MTLNALESVSYVTMDENGGWNIETGPQPGWQYENSLQPKSNRKFLNIYLSDEESEHLLGKQGSHRSVCSDNT